LIDMKNKLRMIGGTIAVLGYVQSILPQEDLIALKRKSGKSNIKDAVAKAVYHYLKCQKTGKEE
jgi:hypothetical protein